MNEIPRLIVAARTAGAPRHARVRGRLDLVPVSSPAVSVAVLCGSVVLVLGSLASLTSALPDISRSTGATQGELTWIVDAYTVVFAGLLLPCGALGDRYGRRRMLVSGLLVFAFACLLGPVGHDPQVLIASRALAGLGAALVMPATLSLITTTMRGAAQDRAVAVWVAAASLGGALGVVGTGLILEFSDWRAVLYALAGGAVLLTVAAVLVDESSEPGQPRVDALGALIGAAAIGLMVFGINEAPAHGWRSAVVWGCVLAGVVLALTFAAVEWRHPHPLLDVRIFRSRTVLTGTVALGALFATIYGIYFLCMQELQLIEGRTPLVAGLMMLPFGLTMVPLSLVAPTLVERLGLRTVFLIGMAPMVATFVLLARLEKGDTGLLTIALLLMGAALGLVIPPGTGAILRSVPAAKQGVASAVNDAVREVGAAFGIAVVGSVLATGYSRDLGPAVGALPEPARGAAEASLGGAMQVGAQLGPAAAPAVAQAREAFLTGLHGAYLVGAAFCVLVSVVIAVAAPGRGVPVRTRDAE